MAAKVKLRRALVSGNLYWASMSSEEEADYLCAVLNAPATTEALRPLMSYGKDERDIHKHVWQLPIQKYDPENATHQRVVQLGRALEKKASAFQLDSALHFAASRRHIRELLKGTPEGEELNDIAYEMLL